MGKTIGIKLKKQEEIEIKKLREIGLTNSEILRRALNNYLDKNDFFQSQEDKCKITMENQDMKTLIEEIREIKTSLKQIETNLNNNNKKKRDNSNRKIGNTRQLIRW
jgi:hypothetical protein